MTAGVYDSSGKTLETSRGPYTISISLSSTGVLSGSTSMSTSSGLAIFTGLRVLSNGIFAITAQSSSILPAVSQNLQITNLVYSLSITSHSTSVTSGFFFNITVNLKGEDSKLFNNSANVTLSATDAFGGTASATTSTGIALFQIYFDSPGYKQITAACGSVNSTLSITVVSPINSDPLCLTPINSTACSQCVPHTNLVAGVCNCIPHSAFSNSTKECDCLSGYSLNQGFCSACANYYNASEISGSYSSDYKSIILLFARSAVTSSTPTCSDLLYLPASLSSLNPTCYWSSSMSLNIVFLQYPPLLGVAIGVNPYQVLARGDICSNNIQTLSVKIANNNPVPTPSSAINAPSSYSLTCTSSSLMISAPVAGSNITYAWSATVTSSNKTLPSTISQVTSNLIELTPSQLYSTTLTVTLTATNTLFLTSSSSTVSIAITELDLLLVIFNTGSAISIKSSNALKITAYVSSCSGSTTTTSTAAYTYTWTYTSSYSLNLSGILGSSDSLTLPASTLSAGLTYVFHVSVTDGTLTGSASVTVTALVSALAVTLSRTSGQVSSTRDFVVRATAVDPDNSTAVIDYNWDCRQSSDICTDPKGNTLVGNTNSNIFTILAPDLTVNAVYLLNLTASTSAKSAYLLLEISVSSLITGNIQLQLTTNKVNHDVDNYLVPVISASSTASFSWNLVALSSAFSISGSFSYLTIPAYTLQAGSLYTVTLIVDDGYTMNATTILACNAPAVCKDISAVEQAGQMTILLTNCVDEDNSDYPLVYQYSIQDSVGNEYWISSPTYSQYLSISLIGSKYGLVSGRACDSLGACTTYSTSIEYTRRRLSLTGDFQSYIRNGQNIPLGIITYSGLAESYDMLSDIYDAMYRYFSQETIDKYEVDLFISCLQGLYTASEFISTGLVNNSTGLTNAVLQKYNNTLSFDQVSKIIETLQSYAIEIEVNAAKTLFDTLSSLSLQNTAPIKQVQIYSNIFFMAYRMYGINITGLEIHLGNILLSIPWDMNLTESTVYDLYYFQYRYNVSDIAQLLFYESGAYLNQTLALSTPSLLTNAFISPVTIKLSSDLQGVSENICAGYPGMNWTMNMCEISPNSLVSLYVPALVTILPSEYSGLELCIYVLYGLIFLGTVLWLILAATDREVEEDSNSVKNFYVIYPITSLMVNQPRPWRFLIMTQLLTNELLLMALVGAFYQYFEDEVILDATGIIRQTIPLGVGQVFSVIMFTINFKFFKHLYYCSIAFCFCIALSSAAAIFMISLQANSKVASYWLSTYCCLLVCDMFVVQAIYSVILSKILKPKVEVVFSGMPIKYGNINIKDIEEVKSDGTPNQRDETILLDNSPGLESPKKINRRSILPGLD